MTKPRRSQQDDFTEQQSLTIVNWVLGTETYELDDGSRDGMCDGLLSKGGAPIAALEVTRNMDEAHAEMMSLLDKIGGKPLKGLACGWMVRYRSGARVAGAAREKLRHILIDLESRGVLRVEVEPEWPEDYDPSTGLVAPAHEADASVLRNLNIEVVRAIGCDDNLPGRIFYTSLTTGSGSASAAPVLEYVGKFLCTEQGRNKVAKLQQADLPPERHLFVWADGRHFPVWTALCEGWLPDQDPDLPVAIDNLWLGSHHAPEAVLRWTRGRSWSAVTIPPAVIGLAPPPLRPGG